MSEGFLTNLHTVELFFRTCRRYKIVAHDDRVALLREITKRGQAAYLRDVAEYCEGKTVLKISRKRSHNDN